MEAGASPANVLIPPFQLVESVGCLPVVLATQPVAHYQCLPHTFTETALLAERCLCPREMGREACHGKQIKDLNEVGFERLRTSLSLVVFSLEHLWRGSLEASRTQPEECC